MNRVFVITVSFLATISVSHALPITQQPATPLPTATFPTQPSLSRGYVQDIVCAIDRLKESLAQLPYVELQPCPSAGYSCGPENSANLATQAHVVNGYAHYVVFENILENYASPDQLFDLLDVVNETMPSLQQNNDVNLTSSSNFLPTVPVCENDTSFQSNCSVHLLNSSLHHLMELHLHTLPTCTSCTSLWEDEQRELSRLHLFFRGDYLDQLLPFQCRILFYFAQYQLPRECASDTYALHDRLEDLTQWMNSTLHQMNQSLPELEGLVDTMSTTILPSTERALRGLRRRDSCMGGVQCTAPGLQLELVEEAASQFALENCFPEPDRLQSAIVIQLFDLTRLTFNSLFDHLLLEEIITL